MASEMGSLQKITIRVFASDQEALRKFYPTRGMQNKVYRGLLRRHISKLESIHQHKLAQAGITDSENLATELVSDLETGAKE